MSLWSLAKLLTCIIFSYLVGYEDNSNNSHAGLYVLLACVATICILRIVLKY